MRRASAQLIVIVVTILSIVPAASQTSDDAVGEEPSGQADAVPEPGTSTVRDGPFVEVSGTSAARPGERVIVLVGGFDATFVTTQICGNSARRGSIDCDQIGSDSIETIDNDTRASWFTVGEPPVPCPCVLRTADTANREVALAPFTLLGHPIDLDLLDDEAIPNPFVVDIEVQRADQGVVEDIKSSLGSATDYEVTVSVRNQWVQPIANMTVTVWASTRDSSRAITTVEVDAPSTLDSSKEWVQTVTATLPAIVRGDALWRIEVTAPSVDRVEVATATNHRPWLLYVLIGALVVDLLILGVRFVLRRLRDDEPDDSPPPPTGSEDIIDLREAIDVREPVLAGTNTRALATGSTQPESR